MAALLLFFFAAVAFGGGALMLKVGISEQREAREIDSLPRLTSADLRRLAPGTAGFVEGRLSEANPELALDLVLFSRSTLYGTRRDDDGRERPIWKTAERRWPRLVLDLGDGEVELEEGYSLTLRGADPSIVAAEKSAAGETEKYEGLRRGQPVCAVGTVSSPGERPVFAAERLISGTIADARSGATTGAVFGWVAGLVLLVAGLVLGGVAWTLL